MSVPVRLLLALASFGVLTTGCGQDGPPVATGANSLEPGESEEVVELAAAMASTVSAGVDDGVVDTMATPSSHPRDDATIDEAGEDDESGVGSEGSDQTANDDVVRFGEGLGASDVPRPMPETVAVIGDSIAKSAEPYVRPALEALGLDVVAYDAVVSRRMINGGGSVPSGRSAIDDVLETGQEPDLWIVALGTNDVAGRSGAEAWAEGIDDVLDEIPNDADVMWVDTWLQRLDADAVEFNAALRDELRRHGNTVALDWHSRAAVDGNIIDDGVHLSESGRIEYARMLGDAISDAYD
jgi:lysophospholipase L1-like esterase